MPVLCGLFFIGEDEAKYQEIANQVKARCPVSKLLKARITIDARQEKRRERKSGPMYGSERMFTFVWIILRMR